MKNGIITGALVLAGISGIALLNNNDSSVKNFNDKNCDNFSSQQEAQTFFKEQGGPAKDSHSLDRDGDGVVCESLK